MLQHKTHYSIGEMCDEFGVTGRALRFYEDEALISPERRGTQRLYTDRDRARLAWILRGKRVGLSLADIALYAYTHVADMGGFRLSDYPNVQAWLDRVAAEPGAIAMEPV